MVGIAVLTGDTSAAIAAWEVWHRDRRRPWTLSVDSERRAVIRAYVSAMLEGRDPVADVAAYLAPYTGQTAEELAARLPQQGMRDRLTFFRGLERAVDGAQLAVCQRLASGSSPDSLRLGPETVPLVAALRPNAPLPGLLLVDRTPGPATATEWLRAAATAALDLAAALPGFAVGLAVDRARLDAALGQAHDSFLLGRLREGRIDIAAAAPAPPAARPDTAPPPAAAAVPAGADAEVAPSDLPVAELERAARWVRVGLEQTRASTNTLTAFDEAVRLLHAETEGEQAGDRARSAAERFLFQHLAEHPETAGHFELNRTLPVRFGPRDVEVDLLSTSLAVAVEVDGWHHFRNADAFRRDRRKDLLLQSLGLLVVRCLARDVVTRLDEVMDLVLTAVRTKSQELDPADRQLE